MVELSGPALHLLVALDAEAPKSHLAFRSRLCGVRTSTICRNRPFEQRLRCPLLFIMLLLDIDLPLVIAERGVACIILRVMMKVP